MFMRGRPITMFIPSDVENYEEVRTELPAERLKLEWVYPSTETMRKNQTAVMRSPVTKRRLSGLVSVLGKQNIEFDQNLLDERLRVEACLCRGGKRRASRLAGVSRCLQVCPVVYLTVAVTGTEAKTAEPTFISFQPERSSTSSPPSLFCLTLRSGRRGITSDTPTVSNGKEKVA